MAYAYWGLIYFQALKQLWNMFSLIGLIEQDVSNPYLLFNANTFMYSV